MVPALSPVVTVDLDWKNRHIPVRRWTVGQYIVMNDYLEFDGKIIMNADPVEKKTPTPGRIYEFITCIRQYKNKGLKIC